MYQNNLLAKLCHMCASDALVKTASTYRNTCENNLTAQKQKY